MAYDINVALERLEKNLQNLQSAKEQVESTVSANAELQKIVSGYVASVNSILEETLQLKQEVTTMKSQKIVEIKEAVELVEKLCNDITRSFKNDTKETLRVFDTENSKLSQAIVELHNFQTKLEKSIEVSSSVDTKLDKTSKEVLILQSTQKENFDTVAQQLEEQMKALVQKINETSQALTEQLIGLDTFLKEIELLDKDIQTKCNQIVQTVNDTYIAVENLNKCITEQHIANMKAINLNRWIFVGGIILLTILHIVIK